MAVKKLRFNHVTGIISILGFIGIIIAASSGFDFGLWAESIMFLVFGAYLMVSGGYHLIFNYFKDGLTPSEMNKIAAVVIGFLSISVGILSSPIFNINLEIFDGFKVVVSIIAIISIAFEMFLGRK